MTFSDFFARAAKPACLIFIAITVIFIIWLLADSNASAPNTAQIHGITAGIVIFTALALAAGGAHWWLDRRGYLHAN